MSDLQSRFLRFGESCWRSTIDPKRPKERKKNNFEKHRTRKGEKKGNKDDKKGQYELSKCFDRVWPSTGPSARKRKGEQFGWLRPPGSRHVSNNVDQSINNYQETTCN